MTIPVEFAGVSGILSVSGISGNVAKPLRHLRSLERRPLSNLSVSHPLDSSPGRRALGKEVSFSMKLICVCRKTSRNAKASHFERLPRPGEVARKCRKGTRWHGEAVTERARMLPKSQTHSDTSPVCQSHRIAVLSCFILPGLPSQALARQLSQRESPWQRGFVFDETDLRLLENVTECQSLPY